MCSVAPPTQRSQKPPTADPQQLVDKADEALNILKSQMEQIKFQYDALSECNNQDIAAERGRLEAQALTIKDGVFNLTEFSL